MEIELTKVIETYSVNSRRETESFFELTRVRKTSDDVKIFAKVAKTAF